MTLWSFFCNELPVGPGWDETQWWEAGDSDTVIWSWVISVGLCRLSRELYGVPVVKVQYWDQQIFVLSLSFHGDVF